MRARSFSLLAALALAGACAPKTKLLPPNGQLLIHIDTDAPLPAAAGTKLAPDDPLPLFDRLRLEVYRPGEDAPCPDCTHEFDLDRDLVKSGKASIGITPPLGVEGYTIRARLFRGAWIEQGQPRADATIDATVALPPIGAEGVTHVSIVLRTEDVAKVIGTRAQPLTPVLGEPGASLVGSWEGARRTRCSGERREGEVCVPGGAYWMGNPLTRHLDADVGLRIVTLSPFFLDDREVTVRAFREAGVAQYRDPMQYDVIDGDPGPIIHCTLRLQGGDTDDLPVNCISWERAAAYCEQKGGTLPTEAQLQYVASNFGASAFVWGDDVPSCDDATFGRHPSTINEVRCPGAWVEPAGSGGRDRLVIDGSGTIFDLAGNLAEYARDLWNLQSESCWGTGIRRDPVCEAPSTAPNTKGEHTVVAGSFLDFGGALAAGRRREAFPFIEAQRQGPGGGIYAALVTSVGFRCARSGQ